jgi:hypothetical protein
MANNTGKKYGGRQLGTPNKLTKDLREKLKEVISMELANLPEYFSQLDTQGKIDLLVKLIPYVLPKVTPIESNAGEPLTFDWT